MSNQMPPPPIPSSSLISKFLGEEQDPDQVQQVYTKVKQILTAGEEIQYIAVQKPLMNLSPDSVILTNKRFIVYKPKLLGQVNFEDYIWRNLGNAKLSEGVITSTLSFTTPNGLMTLGHLPKAQARKLYAFAQEMEEKALEERRLRQMEEMRAGAGGIVFQGGMPTPTYQTPITTTAPTTASVQDDPMQKLKKLKEMLDAGLITQEEYDTKKANILANF